MSLPSKRTLGWIALAVSAVVGLREWNIRRHIGGLSDWPRGNPADHGTRPLEAGEAPTRTYPPYR